MSTLSTMPGLVIPAVGVAAQQEVCLLAADPADPVAMAMARRGIRTCRAHQPIARLQTPAEPGQGSGISPTELRLGKFVTWDEKAAVYVAAKSGHVWLDRGRLEVEDALELLEDIDIATGAVQYDGQLLLHRSILDSALVKAAGSVTVHGAVEAAEVHAGGDLHVLHGICGKERGIVSAQGRLTARFITNARATSGGDMLIANEVVNSFLTCGGLLKVENGTILAGHALSLGGIQCHTAGSDAGVKTILEAGLSAEYYEAIQKTAAAAEVSLHKAREIREKVEPLMVHAKKLTAAQKEKATELLFAADEAETRANRDLAAVTLSRNTLRACLGTRIVVASLLHPGVIIRFPVAEAMVTTRFRGPVEIAVELRGTDAQVVVIDRSRDAATPLPHVPGSEVRTEFNRRFLAGPAATP